jgi:hypothetical protein
MISRRGGGRHEHATWRRRLRLFKAVELLAGDLSVTQIALELGSAGNLAGCGSCRRARLPVRRKVACSIPPIPSCGAARDVDGLLHRRCWPAQRHRRIAPTFDIAADAPNGAHHVLYDVGGGQRAAQRYRQAEPDHSQHLIEPFEDAGRNARRVATATSRHPARSPAGKGHGTVSTGVSTGTWADRRTWQC